MSPSESQEGSPPVGGASFFGCTATDIGCVCFVLEIISAREDWFSLFRAFCGGFDGFGFSLSKFGFFFGFWSLLFAFQSFSRLMRILSSTISLEVESSFLEFSIISSTNVVWGVWGGSRERAEKGRDPELFMFNVRYM